MTYTVFYHPLVVTDDIPHLDTTNKRRIRRAIEEKLTTHPDIFGIPLRRSLTGHRKLRVGDYRIVFRITKNRVIVFAIMHRSVIYKRVASRS